MLLRDTDIELRDPSATHEDGSVPAQRRQVTCRRLALMGEASSKAGCFRRMPRESTCQIVGKYRKIAHAFHCGPQRR